MVRYLSHHAYHILSMGPLTKENDVVKKEEKEESSQAFFFGEEHR